MNQDDKHREEIDGNHNGISINKLFNTAVSRPVGRKEMMEDEDARKSMRKEWLGQHAAGVYDFSVVREYDDVVAEAKKSGKEVHMARIHGICVEKNYQLPKGHPNRKFKGRGVLLGNQVKNQSWEAAFFQDLGNSPATFEASRWADFYGCLPGNDVKLADAIQAYIQAILTDHHVGLNSLKMHGLMSSSMKTMRRHVSERSTGEMKGTHRMSSP